MVSFGRLLSQKMTDSAKSKLSSKFATNHLEVLKTIQKYYRDVKVYDNFNTEVKRGEKFPNASVYKSRFKLVEKKGDPQKRRSSQVEVFHRMLLCLLVLRKFATTLRSKKR